MWEYLKARIHNYAFWIGIVAQLSLILTLFGVKVDNDRVMTVAQAVLGLLGMLGIINNPTTANPGLADDKKSGKIVK